MTPKYLRMSVNDAGHAVVVDMSWSSEHSFCSNDTLKIEEDD